MLIRQYCTADMDAVIDIWYEGWHAIDAALVHPHSKSMWRERWVSEIIPRHEVVVAEAGNEILGFVTFNRGTSELSQLFSKPSAPGRGVGRALIDWVKNNCDDQIYLFTLAINQRSRRFYEKHGFRETGRATNPLSGLPSVRYEWRKPEQCMQAGKIPTLKSVR